MGITLLFGNLIFRRIQSKKKFTMYAYLVSRIFVCSSGLIPFLPIPFPSELLFALLVVGYMANIYAGTTLNTWYISVIPVPIRGRYVSLRCRVCTIITITIPVLAGMYMDSILNKKVAFSGLCLLGFILALFEFYCFSQIEDPEIGKRDACLKLSDTILKPLQCKPYLSFILSLATFYVLYYISASYQQVYYIRYMKLSYTFINILTLFNAVVQLIAYKYWGKLCDKRGAQSVVLLSVWFYTLEYLMWSLSTQQNIHYISFFAFFFTGIAIPGFSLGVFNRRFEICPEENRTTFESFFQVAVGLSLLLSSVIAALVKSLLETSASTWKMENGELKILFMITFFGLLTYQVVQTVRYIRGIRASSRTGRFSNKITKK